MEYIYLGRNELVALVVGLVTGAIYSFLNLPIPAPNVLGGILAIIFTFIGYAIVRKFRGQITFGRPPSRNLASKGTSHG
jgi:XapX domain-containing protein